MPGHYVRLVRIAVVTAGLLGWGVAGDAQDRNPVPSPSAPAEPVQPPSAPTVTAPPASPPTEAAQPPSAPAEAVPPAQFSKAERKFVEIAERVSGLVSKGDWEAFEKTVLVDRKSYSLYYEKRHSIVVEERGWQEYLDGMRRNFDDKHKAMAEDKLSVTRVQIAREGTFEAAEVWAAFKTADPKTPGSLVLQVIKISGKWRVTSLE